MNSMTGFGRAEARGGGVAVTVELKSVNNRFRDINMRCPRELAALEPRIAGLVKARFSRGRIEVYVRRVATAGNTKIQLNEDHKNFATFDTPDSLRPNKISIKLRKRKITMALPDVEMQRKQHFS